MVAPVSVALDRTGDGPPLVLVHGVGTNRAVWRRATPHLAAGRLVVAPDLPGFGESPPPPLGYDLTEVARLVANGLRTELEEPFDLLGHSLGGAVAVVLAARHPGLVRGLVLSAPAGFRPRPESVARAAGALAGPVLALRRVLGVPTASSGLARRLLLAAAVADGASLDPAAARELYRASESATALGAAVTSVAAANLELELTSVTAPIALIWGERDRVMPVATIERIAAVREPRAIVRIAGVGHVAQVERPREFAAAVREALAAVTDS
jgi:pimeloyl-ACP methyl ester carboxylesterase